MPEQIHIVNYSAQRMRKTIDSFSDVIDKNYLFNICTEILNSQNFQTIINNKRYPNVYEAEPGQSYDDYYYDVAVNVSMIHFFYSAPFNRDRNKLISLYNSANHHQRLVNKTLEQCNLRLYLNPSDRVARTTHIPVVFSMTCLINDMLKKFDKYLNSHMAELSSNYTLLFGYNSLRQTFTIARTIVSSFEQFDFSSAYTLLRMLMETFFVYLAIRDDDEAVNKYYKLLQLKNDYYNNGSKYTKEFKEIAPKNHRLWKNYSNYGWLDTIAEDPDTLSYTFREVLEYSSVPEVSRDADGWMFAYSSSSRFSHGNLYTLVDYGKDLNNICITLGQLLVNMANFSLKFLDMKPTQDDGVDLIQNLKENIDDLGKLIESYSGFNKNDGKQSTQSATSDSDN